MENNFQELKNIFNELEYTLNGLSVFLLSNEDEPYKLYKLRMSSQLDVYNIILKNIAHLHSAQLYNYHENVSPSRSESVSIIKESEVPNYDKIRELILNDESTNLTKKIFNQVTDFIKGYAVDLVVTNKRSEEEFHVIFFSDLNKSHFYKPHASLYSFGNETGDVLEKVDITYLELKDNGCAINFNGDIFVIHGFYFERLFNYEIHIDTHSESVLEKINDSGLIDNWGILEDHCMNNKNFKRKLYSISMTDKLSGISYEIFKEMKNLIGDGLFLTLNESTKTIAIDEGNSHKSVDQIIRIINDEAAETLVSQTQIFANQKISIG